LSLGSVSVDKSSKENTKNNEATTHQSHFKTLGNKSGKQQEHTDEKKEHYEPGPPPYLQSNNMSSNPQQTYTQPTHNTKTPPGMYPGMTSNTHSHPNNKRPSPTDAEKPAKWPKIQPSQDSRETLAPILPARSYTHNNRALPEKPLQGEDATPKLPSRKSPISSTKTPASGSREVPKIPRQNLTASRPIPVPPESNHVRDVPNTLPPRKCKRVSQPPPPVPPKPDLGSEITPQFPVVELDVKEIPPNRPSLPPRKSTGARR